MENFFSTISQITFTVIGLFFVSVTFDAETRKFWFYEKFYSRYTYFTFLVMLFPGFLSIGGLVSAKENEFPAWTITGLIFLFIYIWVFLEFRKLKKSYEYKKIKELEYSLDVYGTLRFHLVFLLILPAYGFLCYVVDQHSILRGVETIVRTYICLSVASNVLPMMVFTKKIVNDKNDVSLTTTLVSQHQVNNNPKNGSGFIFLIVALFFFLIGLLFPRK